MDEALYNYGQVLKECLKYFGGDLMAASTVAKKYLMRHTGGKFVENNPDMMHRRLVAEFVRIESKFQSPQAPIYYQDRFYEILHGFKKTVPQGSPMAGIGNPYQLQSLSNCFVVESPHDSITGIFQTGLEIAEIQKRRGGVGVDLSTLRPFGSRVNNAAATSAGTPCFSDFYSHITRMIGQLGRQGALMITLSIKHPDAKLFATMKQDFKKVTGANVSLRISDEFMVALTEGKTFRQQWPVDASIPEVIQDVDPRELWDVIVDSAWKFAEPGLLMWDNYCNTLPAHLYPGFKTKSTNPCSELGLSPYDSCRLISQNLYGWVASPFTKHSGFDFDSYYWDTRVAQRMSDDLVELELEVIQKIIDRADNPTEKDLWRKIYTAGHTGRRTGLGTHALADVFLALGIRYDSDEAIEFADRLFRTHKEASYTESCHLAKERGPFPAWNYDIDMGSPFIDELPESIKEMIREHGRRNISNLTNAPTGSVSIASRTSSGIEPVFRWVYDRKVKITHTDIDLPVDVTDAMGDKWTKFRVVHPAVEAFFHAQGIESPVNGSRDFSKDLESLNEKIQSLLPDYFVTSDKIDYNKGLKLQAVIQKHIDHGISKTINMPKGSTKEQVHRVYIDAWKAGLKGVTVYVDGSRDGVLITSDKKDKKQETNRPLTIVENHAPKRPDVLPAELHIVKVKGKEWYAAVGLLDGKPFEVFAGQSIELPNPKEVSEAFIKKTGSKRYQLVVHLDNNDVEKVSDLREVYDNPEQRTITRSICRELRHGVPIEFIIRDLGDYEGGLVDYVAVLARVLKKYATQVNRLVKKCPDCGGTEFKLIEGCPSCVSCGSSKCN